MNSYISIHQIHQTTTLFVSAKWPSRGKHFYYIIWTHKNVSSLFLASEYNVSRRLLVVAWVYSSYCSTVIAVELHLPLHPPSIDNDVGQR